MTYFHRFFWTIDGVLGSTCTVSVSLLDWAQTGYRVVTPYTRQCFLWAAATVIFARFWSFFCKKCMPRISQSWSKKLGSKYYSNHLKWGGFFHNSGSLSKIEGKHLWWSHMLLLLRLFQNWGVTLISGKLADIRLWSNEAATGKEMIRNYFFKIEGRSLILEKNDPPLRVTGCFGA